MSEWIKITIIAVLLAVFITALMIAKDIRNKDTYYFDTDEVVIIDDNMHFTSPEFIFPGEEKNLTAGIYYWKTENGPIKKIEIESLIKVTQKNNIIKNTGNTKINANSITGFSVLDIGEEKIMQGPLEVEQHE